ncbi:aquaporin family protein [Peteryoungia desertarenae]|uniref:Aquaporin family protein n=1 Tax=Peteryoungia desertarenae TaxID=1813451 RepID=A0ABX6QR44_9HYPH|nr:MIP/aquaporin family protein [Peteryoungia desertarenae]QLF70732.1 aquaporin family protein [Peteryoungia desertarenae]
MTNSRRLMAEFLGTAFLLATVVGSGIMAEALAGGNVAIALLGNTIPTGAILVVLITMFGPISGAHFNPAVTIVMLLLREMDRKSAGLYILMQVAGGLVGVWLAHLMFDLATWQMSLKLRSGLGQWVAEGVATFGLLVTILLTRRYRPEGIAVSVGLYITAAYWFTASTSFANPAVTLARAFSDSFAGIRLQDVPVFVVMQILGAIMALVVVRWFLNPEPKQPG